MVYGGHLVIRLWETLLVIDHMEITDSITNAVLVYIMLYGKEGQENTQEWLHQTRVVDSLCTHPQSLP